MSKENTGKVLKAIREFKRLDQKDVAGATGINKSSYNRMEKGKIDIRLSDIALIAAYYGIPPYLLVAMIGDCSIAALEREGSDV